MKIKNVDVVWKMEKKGGIKKGKKRGEKRENKEGKIREKKKGEQNDRDGKENFLLIFTRGVI